MNLNRPLWNERCDDILRRTAGQYTNAEIAALIEAATGLRFSVYVVSRHRARLGLARQRRNDWSAPLRRWSGPRVS
jgi:hypothetical protein